MLLASARRALQVLRAANKALESAYDEQQLLDDICRISVEVGGYRFAWVGYAVEDEAKSIRFMAHAGKSSDYLNNIRITWDESETGLGPAGIAIRSNEPHIVRHISDSERFAPWRTQALEYGFQSVIALPLRWRDTLFGCMAILSPEPDAFDEGEAELLGELASSLSYGINALRTATAHEQASQALRTERDTQAVLRQIIDLSLDDLSLEEKLDHTLELLFDIPWLAIQKKGSVFLLEDGADHLQLISKRHLSPVLHDMCARVPLGHCLCGKAAANGELLFSNHVDDSHTTRFDGIEDHGHYCQPIRSARGVIGVLNLYINAGHKSSSLETEFLASVANTLAGVIEREQGELARQRLVTLLEATPDLVTITDTQGNCLYCNDSAKSILGLTEPGRGRSNTVFDHYPEKIAKDLRQVAYPLAMRSGLWEGEVVLNTPSDEPLPVSLLVLGHKDRSGEVAHLSTIGRDISDRIHAQQALQELAVHEQRFANSLINSLPGIFYLTDVDGRLLRWNNNLEKLLGSDARQLSNTHLSSHLSAETWDQMKLHQQNVLLHGSASLEADFVDDTHNAVPYFITCTLVRHAELEQAIVGIGIDISYRKQLEEELQKRASTDPLTGAYNRLKMEEALESEMARSKRYHRPLSIIMLDIDHFKQVNDTHGHDAGDDVLRAFVHTTRLNLRETDILARWGGEEFMILAPCTTLDEIHTLADRIRNAVQQHTIIPGISITASFGVGQLKGGESQKELLKRVDDALYLAKYSGRNQVRLA